MSNQEPFRVAAVQATPVFLDREATIDKACGLIAEVGAAGARFAVFPEAFVPSFPLWVWFVAPYKTPVLAEAYAELVEQSVAIPSASTDRLCAAAREAGVAVAIGVNECNRETSGATLYDTILFIGPDGTILGKHRKLVPTTAERLVWGQGDGTTLQVYELPFGRISGLLCWENYMPLARYTLYALGAQIHAALTYDRGEPWTSTLRHIAMEGGVYTIGCCSPYRRDDIPDRFAFKQFVPEKREWVNRGGSAIVGPDGGFLVEPVHEREEILYAEVQPRVSRGQRFQLDVVGHYARPDIFQLTVNRSPRPMIRIEQHDSGPRDAAEATDVPIRETGPPEEL